MTVRVEGGRAGVRNEDLPAVSVIIPARNEAAYIAAALSSVLSQEYLLERIDCVVADNGSSDATAAITTAFGEAHPAMTLRVVSEPVRGVGRAKNAGAGAATGQIFIFLDADSRMAPDLARQVALFYLRGHPVASIKVTADGGTRLERAFFALMEFGKVRFGVRAQMMYCERRLFFALGGFRPDFQIAEDLDFLKRASEHLRDTGAGSMPHLSTSEISTSPRRLRRHRFNLGILAMFARWILAFLGLGRGRAY